MVSLNFCLVLPAPRPSARPVLQQGLANSRPGRRAASGAGSSSHRGRVPRRKGTDCMRPVRLTSRYLPSGKTEEMIRRVESQGVEEVRGITWRPRGRAQKGAYRPRGSEGGAGDRRGRPALGGTAEFGDAQHSMKGAVRPAVWGKMEVAARAGWCDCVPRMWRWRRGCEGDKEGCGGGAVAARWRGRPSGGRLDKVHQQSRACAEVKRKWP